jgi:predicted nucleotidyltransferase
MNFISKYKNQLNQLCVEHNVETLYVFGSASTNTMTESSDIDLLVRFKKFDLLHYFENYMAFKTRLKNLFNRDIDLVEEQSLKNPILIQSIDKSKEQVYG